MTWTWLSSQDLVSRFIYHLPKCWAGTAFFYHIWDPCWLSGNCFIQLPQVCDLLFPSPCPPVKVVEPCVKGLPLADFSGRLPISTSFSCFSWAFILSLHLGLDSAFSSWLAFCNAVFVLAAVGPWFFLPLLSAIWWRRQRGWCKLLDRRAWQWGKLGLALVGRALLSKAFNQLSADG